MAEIVKTHTYPDGQMIGWDAEVGGWVELDEPAGCGDTPHPATIPHESRDASSPVLET